MWFVINLTSMSAVVSLGLSMPRLKRGHWDWRGKEALTCGPSQPVIRGRVLFATRCRKMTFHLVMVFIAALGLFMGLVRTFQASAYFGWVSKRLRSIWLTAGVSTVGLAVIGYVNAVQLSTLSVVAAAAAGILLGALLLTTRKPRWPNI